MKAISSEIKKNPQDKNLEINDVIEFPFPLYGKIFVPERGDNYILTHYEMTCQCFMQDKTAFCLNVKLGYKNG